MKQKIRYRITTTMGIWYAYNRVEHANLADDERLPVSHKYFATRAVPNDGKYEPLASTTFNCDHVVEYLGKSKLIETRDDRTA